MRESAMRDWSVTSDSCGAATLTVEARGERTYLWRHWHAENFPFVCALLEELGKTNPFTGTEPTPATAEAATRDRSARR